MKKPLPVSMDKQKEVLVNYAIAKFRDKGIAFKTKENDVKTRFWIKKSASIGKDEFHFTLRFQGVDYKTGAGQDCFDIDVYIDYYEFMDKLNQLKIQNETRPKL